MTAKPPRIPRDGAGRARSESALSRRTMIARAAAAIGGGTPPPPPLPTGVNEVESNNSRGSANLVGAPALVNGTLASGDTDYFRVELPAGKTLTATLNPGPRDFDLYLYSSNGRQLSRSINNAGQTDSVSYSNNGGGAVTLYVRARYYSGGAGSYTLNLGW